MNNFVQAPLQTLLLVCLNPNICVFVQYFGNPGCLGLSSSLSKSIKTWGSQS